MSSSVNIFLPKHIWTFEFYLFTNTSSPSQLGEGGGDANTDQKRLRDLPAQGREQQVSLIQGNSLLPLRQSLCGSRPPRAGQVRWRQLPASGGAWLWAGWEHTALGGRSGQPREVPAEVITACWLTYIVELHVEKSTTAK